MRVMVTGSRTWTSRSLIRAALSGLPAGTVIVHGDARDGADRIAAAVADQFGYVVEPHRADWKQHGRAAGVIRNAEMIATGINLVLAFHKDGSPGTADAVQQAKDNGIPVRTWIVDHAYPDVRCEMWEPPARLEGFDDAHMEADSAP